METSESGTVGKALHGVGRVRLLNIALLGAAVALYYFGVVNLTPLRAPIRIEWWVLAAFFYAAETSVVHLQIRRDAHSFSLNEIPLVIGLFFATPEALVLAQVVGGGAALVLSRKQPAVKLMFNLARYVIDTSIAVLIFRGIFSIADPMSRAGLALPFLATMVVALLGAATITLAISLSEGKLQLKSLPEVLGFTVVAAITNTSLGLIGVTILWIRPEAAWLLLIPAAILFGAYRLYTVQRQRHESLEFLYNSTQLAHRTLKLEPTLLSLLGEARKMFRADIAEIIFFSAEDGVSALRTRLGPGDTSEVMRPVTLDPAQGVWARVASEGESVLLARPIENPRLRQHFERRGIRDAMVAPLYGPSGVVGKMTVANRVSDVSTFGAEDLKLLETLANHASVSIENARLVEKLQDSLEHLTEMNQLKDDFVAAVSHELRTPLTSIQGYVKTLLRPEGTFSQLEQRSFLEAVDRQSDRLRNLIEDLLVVSRLESHSDRPSHAPIDIHELVGSVVEEFGPSADEHEIHVMLDNDVGDVEGDRGKIHQILSNLLDNALKYSPAGSPVRIKSRRQGSFAVIVIEDEGPGIPEHLTDKIFDRFYQVDQSATRSKGGAGLGLYICRKLAEAIDGEIWVGRTAGGGASFELKLPCPVPARVAGLSLAVPETDLVLP